MPTTIVTRASKGSALTHAEVDANFSNLKTTADAAPSLTAPNTWSATQSFALNGSTGVTTTSEANTSTASNTTKTLLAEYVGYDTIGTPKQLGGLKFTPKDVNWVGSIVQIMARSGDTVVPFFTANFPGSPEGVLTAHNGAICLSDNTYLYKKSGGTGNTGWIVLG